MAPPPPPPPPPPAGGYSGGGYYSSNAGSTSSSAARQRLGLGSGGGGGQKPQQQQRRQQQRPQRQQQQQEQQQQQQDDWFASPPAPAPPAAAPAPFAASAAAPSPGSGFYSMNAGGTSSGYGASTAYGAGSSGGNAMSGGGGGGGSGGGYYGSSAGYGASTANSAMSGTIGGGGTGGANVPPASAFGSNPNSGSNGQMSMGMGSNSFEMAGVMGGPIGGAPSGSTAVAPAAALAPTTTPQVFDPSAPPTPHLFDPNAAMATKNQEKSGGGNAMASMEEDYDNEPPLLEELGVNFPHIYSKSRAVLFPIGKHAKSLEAGLIENDADLAGPLAFALGLGGELLLSGKLHFGYVYGFGVSGCLAMTLLLNLLNPNGAVSAWTVVSILGYALLPVNLLAALNAFIRINKLGKVGTVLAVATVAWSTAASARLFERGCNMRAQRFLVAYPTALLYSAFVMITIFRKESRGREG